MNNMFINKTTTSAVSRVASSSNDVGGMVGLMNSATPNASISPSYSTASVIGATNAGGLIGRPISSSVTNSYSTSLVTHSVGSAPQISGLLDETSGTGSVTNSYWNTSTSGHNGGIGYVAPGADPGSSAGVTGKTTRELQTVTIYISIYSVWNNNLDGKSGNDDPWDLGNGMQYSMLERA